MLYRLLLLTTLFLSSFSSAYASNVSANKLIEDLDALLEQSLKGRMIEKLRRTVGDETNFDLYYRSSVEELKGEDLEELLEDLHLDDAMNTGSRAGKIFVDATGRMRQQEPFIARRPLTSILLYSSEADFCDRLKFIPFALVKFPILKCLNLSHNAFFCVPRFFADFKLLKSLNLSHNCLIHWPVVLGELPTLQRLDLSYNQLMDVSSLVGNLTNLTSLDLAGNRIKELPPQIGNLQKLISLNLRGNCLNALPEPLKHLQKLETLILSENLFLSFPEFLSNLESLKILFLSFNASRSIPECLPLLTRLEELHLTHHQIGGSTKEIIDMLNAHKGEHALPKLKLIRDDIKPSEK